LIRKNATRERNNRRKKEKDLAVPSAIMRTVIVIAREKTVEIEKISETDVIRIEEIEKEKEDIDIEMRIYDLQINSLKLIIISVFRMRARKPSNSLPLGFADQLLDL
jgi:hypothetical protein